MEQVNAHAPSTIEMARFLHRNPGAYRGEILKHLHSKVKSYRWDSASHFTSDEPLIKQREKDWESWHVCRVANGARCYRRREATWKEVSKNGFNAHLSPYTSKHLTRKVRRLADFGTRCEYVEVEGDWERKLGENGRWQYFLTEKGKRLLNAPVIPSSDRRAFPYRNPEDYNVEFHYLDLTKMEPEDLMGLPHIRDNGSHYNPSVEDFLQGLRQGFDVTQGKYAALGLSDYDVEDFLSRGHGYLMDAALKTVTEEKTDDFIKIASPPASLNDLTGSLEEKHESLQGTVVNLIFDAMMMDPTFFVDRIAENPDESYKIFGKALGDKLVKLSQAAGHIGWAIQAIEEAEE